jgi:tryptophan-rich sensory protein
MNVAQSDSTPTPTSARVNKPKWRWYHGVLFYVAIQVISFGLSKLTEGLVGRGKAKLTESLTGNADSFNYSNSLKQPIFAPPDWVFVPVWLVNNAIAIWGLLYVANQPTNQPGRGAFLWLQGAIWSLYTAFITIFFGLRSPINGALNTILALVFTVASTVVAVSRLRDRKAILSQILLLPWLIFASFAGTVVALWNKDDFYGTGALVQPDAKWVKPAKDSQQPEK